MLAFCGSGALTWSARRLAVHSRGSLPLYSWSLLCDYCSSPPRRRLLPGTAWFRKLLRHHKSMTKGIKFFVTHCSLTRFHWRIRQFNVCLLVIFSIQYVLNANNTLPYSSTHFVNPGTYKYLNSTCSKCPPSHVLSVYGRNLTFRCQSKCVECELTT